MQLQIINRFIDALPADISTENSPRLVSGACYSWVEPKKPLRPSCIHASDDVLALLGISMEEAKSLYFTEIFSGLKIYPKSKPYAMNYAGHQFGQWAGQLGDGRAITLFEAIYNSNIWQCQLKGAGVTPYSRRGDGLAVLRSSIREHLCSEAMHNLGIPSTRSLCLMATGEEVLRDILYDGNAAYEPGAIVCRIAPTFLRFGSFELFTAQNDVENLKKIVDYTIKNHYPTIAMPDPEAYLTFFKIVCEKTVNIIVSWQRVGFVHGVMNTDNMSILGLTIDYGPFGFLDDYNPHWTPNTTDGDGKRYTFGNQPNVAIWNLIQLANALYPLIQNVEKLETVLNSSSQSLQEKLVGMKKEKLGLFETFDDDKKLLLELENLLQTIETDYTIFYREISYINQKTSTIEAVEMIKKAFYNSDDFTNLVEQKWINWLQMYSHRIQKELLSAEERNKRMLAVNPKFILRNYMLQLAIEAAEKEDYSVLMDLYECSKNPYDDADNSNKWYDKRPDWARTKVGCSMLSCSS